MLLQGGHGLIILNVKLIQHSSKCFGSIPPHQKHLNNMIKQIQLNNWQACISIMSMSKWFPPQCFHYRYNPQGHLVSQLKCCWPFSVTDFLNVGSEDGKKYMEKTINKHHEIVESIKELSNGLLDLEAKLQVMKTPNIILYFIVFIILYFLWNILLLIFSN